MKVILDHVEYVAHMIYIVSVELVTKTKIIVFGLLKRHGKVYTQIVPNVSLRDSKTDCTDESRTKQYYLQRRLAGATMVWLIGATNVTTVLATAITNSYHPMA